MTNEGRDYRLAVAAMEKTFGTGKETAYLVLRSNAEAKRIYDCAIEALVQIIQSQATPLRWESDPDPVSPIDLIAFAGEVPVGGVKQSGSGRFRWEIVQLPGNSLNRDDRHGWLQTEAEAKAKVQAEWNVWRRRSE